MSEKKNTHGGARRGAGRPAGLPQKKFLSTAFREAGLDPSEELVQQYIKSNNPEKLAILKDFSKFLFVPMPTEHQVNLQELPKIVVKKAEDDE